jgi:hypothetical protein
MFKYFISITFVGVVFAMCLLSSCSKLNPTKPEDSDPQFTMTIKNVILGDGTDGFEAYGMSNMDVVMTKIIATSPIGGITTVNCGNALCLSGQSYSILPSGYAFRRYIGQWSFVFIGKVDVTDKSFNITRIVNIQ